MTDTQNRKGLSIYFKYTLFFSIIIFFLHSISKNLSDVVLCCRTHDRTWKTGGCCGHSVLFIGGCVPGMLIVPD